MSHSLCPTWRRYGVIFRHLKRIPCLTQSPHLGHSKRGIHFAFYHYRLLGDFLNIIIPTSECDCEFGPVHNGVPYRHYYTSTRDESHPFSNLLGNRLCGSRGFSLETCCGQASDDTCNRDVCLASSVQRPTIYSSVQRPATATTIHTRKRIYRFLTGFTSL